MNNECSVSKYKRAFTQLRGHMTESQYKMLLSHYRSPHHTTSPRRMAKALKWTNRGAANRHYGKFAATLGGLLKRSAKYKVELLCSFECNRRGEIVWVMHDNVVRALEDLGWVKSQPRILASRGPYQARKKDLARV